MTEITHVLRLAVDEELTLEIVVKGPERVTLDPEQLADAERRLAWCAQLIRNESL